MNSPRRPPPVLHVAALGGAAAFGRFALSRDLPRRLPAIPPAKPWLAVREWGLLFRHGAVAERAARMLAPHDPGVTRDGLTVRARVPFALAAAVVVAAGLGELAVLAPGKGRAGR